MNSVAESIKAPDGRQRPWYLYMIQTCSGKLYTGITTDVQRRFSEHCKGGKGAKYFRIDPPQAVVYQQLCADRSAACREEARIKSLSRSQKLQLIKNNSLIEFKGNN